MPMIKLGKTSMVICPTLNLHHSSKMISTTEGRRKGPVSFGLTCGLTWLPWKQSRTSDKAWRDGCGSLVKPWTLSQTRVTSSTFDHVMMKKKRSLRWNQNNKTVHRGASAESELRKERFMMTGSHLTARKIPPNVQQTQKHQLQSQQWQKCWPHTAGPVLCCSSNVRLCESCFLRQNSSCTLIASMEKALHMLELSMLFGLDSAMKDKGPQMCIL